MTEVTTRSRAKVAMRLAMWLGVLCLAAAVGIGVWFERAILSSLPEDLASVLPARASTAAQVFDARGDLFDQFYVERRFHVPLDELPPHVPAAFVSAEDHRFWDHPGVDIFGIARAAVANLRAGRTTQGGSTITQQLVKNLIVGSERSYRRKLSEAVLAYRLEKELGKPKILDMYLNYVALGSGNYGVEAAARDYFGVSARDLDVGQAAMIAGLVPAPSRYSPWVDPGMAARRRELVLRSMVRDGVIDADAALLFLDRPVSLPWVAEREHRAAAYATQVRREVRRLLGDELPHSEGIRVHTALDLRVQDVAQEAIQRALDAHVARQGPRAIHRRLAPDDRPGFLARAGGLPRDAETGAAGAPSDGSCFDAMVGDDRSLDRLQAGPHLLSLRASDRRVLVQPAATPDRRVPLSAGAQPGDVLAVCVAGDEVVLDPAPWAEGAAVVLENATGRVVAVVGGRDVQLEGFVRATQAKLQPGSSFKPYVYATALLHGATQLDTVVDGPIALPAGGGKTWRPRNYNGRFAGAMPMRSALAQSLNTVAVRLLLRHGAGEVARVARAMGVSSPIRRDPTIALGSNEVTVLDQALGYATIARAGRTTDAVWIDRVEDADGALLARAGGRVVVGGEPIARLPGGPGQEALPPGVAYQLADMMRDVVRVGTARSAWDPKRDRMGKTGTTNGFADAWFVGFTPRWTVAVWIGTDGERSLGDKETGGRSALPAWRAIVEAAGEDEARLAAPPEALLVNDGGRWVAIDRATAPIRFAPAPKPGPIPAYPGAPKSVSGP